MKTRLQDRFTRMDLVALLAFAAVWIFYIFTVRYGYCTSDESVNIECSKRLVLGIRPLVDEWSHLQFSFLPLCLPYRVYTAVTGGTAGIVLFMRYLFLAFNAVIYWIVYIRLRPYRWPALVATMLFCIYVPFTFFSINYYSAPIRLLMLVCLCLFSEKQPRLALAASGVLLAYSVLLQPGFAFLYFGYTVLVWIRFFRQKKNKRFLNDFAFCVDTRAWKFLTAGVLLCAAVFLIWLFSRSNLRDILTTIPNLFTDDPEYDFTNSIFKKIAEAATIYGLACACSALAIVALSIVYACGLFRKNRGAAQKLLFCLACAVWILSCIPTFRSSDDRTPTMFFSIYPAPLLWFGLVCFLLGTRKNKRFLLFWVVGLCASLCVDFFSNNSMSLGCPISYIADLVFFVDLVRELRAEQPQKSAGTVFRRNPKRIKFARFCIRWIPRLTCLCFAVWFGFVLMMENTAFPEHYIFGTPLFSLPVVCEKGPSRSLHYSETYGRKYNTRLSDADTLLQKEPKNLFVYGEAPEMYLYVDIPIAACSPWAQQTRSELTRQIRFWKLHPERVPECIYVPFEKPYETVSQEDPKIQSELSGVHEAFDPLCAYTVEIGEGGFILYVSHWNLETTET